ncbi:MAG TPA: ATP-binding protein [Myxococcaceae bacterium]|jgi:signal transduction histidine kinase
MSQSSQGGDNHAPPEPKPGPVLQLEAVEERLLVVLGLTDGIVFEMDAQGRYLAVWAKSDALLAMPREQFLGRTLAEVLGPQAAAPFMERIQRIVSTGQPERFEYSMEIPAGLRWYSADGVALPPGRSVGFLIRDITRFKELEQRLFQADRLAALGTLAAGVAHEVSNPLSYVSTNLNFALGELAKVLSSLEKGAAEPATLEHTVREALDALSEAREGALRIRQIVGDLKTFARGQDTAGSRANARRAIEACFSIASMELRHRAQLIQRLEDVPEVRGSEARLGQVFLNLLINAAQAIPEGAPDKNRVEVRLRAEGQWVVAEVEDTGAGIPPELHKRIFDPFFSTRPAGVGTGLGLSICHGIVTELGGEISVHSTPGQGSCFRVRLPVA